MMTRSTLFLGTTILTRPTDTEGTFGDDPAIWQHNVLGAASGDHCDRRMQPQTLLDTHGQEGQLGQVVPEEHAT